MDRESLTPKELVDLSKELIDQFNTIKEQRSEISAQNGDKDTGVLLSLTKLMREILEFHVWSLQKGKSLSFILVTTPSNLFSARFAHCWALRRE